MIGVIQFYLFLALGAVAFAIELWALVDCARRPAPAFPYAGKRTKTFWLALTALGALIGFLSTPWPTGFAALPVLFLFGAVIPAGIYLADVKPEVARYSGRGGRGGSSGSQGPYGPW